MAYDSLRRKHKTLALLLKKEIARQRETIDLIASENYVSPAVREALGAPFANKYAEGYPGKRYYPGNRFVDGVEEYAIQAAKKVFGLSDRWHANVQPYSGSPANAAVYMALMNFGDTLMGMGLSSGGHLTHGHPVTFSGRAYRSVQYKVHPATGLIDYDAVESLAKTHKPKVIVSGFSAYPRGIDFKRFGAIAKKVGAYHVADISHIAGLVAAGLHRRPFPYADVVVTTTHKTLRGPRGAIIFCTKELSEKVDKAVFPGLQGGPHMNEIFAKAVACDEARTASFRAYQRQIIRNARALAESLARLGFALVSGGTDTHLLLVDLRRHGVDGREAERRLEAVGITANRNSIPGDEKPFRPSGIRLGVPAMTTRGMKEGEMKILAALMASAIVDGPTKSVSGEVFRLCRRFPLR